MSLFSRTSAFNPEITPIRPGSERRPRGLPPKPPMRVEIDVPSRNAALVGYDELESWYTALNDLYNSRTSARLPETVSEALADVRDSIYGHLR
jgi:NAD kinase